MSDYQDTEPPPRKVTTGAQFARGVRDDADKWAAAFLEAYAAQEFRTAASQDQQAFVAKWFHDAMDAARNKAIDDHAPEWT